MEKVSFETDDNLKIAANFYKPQIPCDRVVILLHRFKKDKEDWKNFVKNLLDEGFCVLALDFRGHGESDGDLDSFKDEDFCKMTEDIKAAIEFLKGKNPKFKFGIVGASIGANTALNFATQNPKEAKTIALLSPGLEYHGVKIKDSIGKYEGALLIIAAEDDEYSFSSSKELFAKCQSEDKMFQTYPKGGHANEIFLTHPKLTEFLLSWLTLRV